MWCFLTGKGKNGIVIAAFIVFILINVNMSNKLVITKVKLHTGLLTVLKLKTKATNF